MHICVCTYVYIHVHVCTYVCVYVYVFMDAYHLSAFFCSYNSIDKCSITYLATVSPFTTVYCALNSQLHILTLSWQIILCAEGS